MAKQRAKLLIWIVLLACATSAAWGAVRGATELLAYFERGADPASALNIVPNVAPDLHNRLAWDADDADTARPIDAFTRSQIEVAYQRAWLQWNLSYIKGEPYGLKTYFTGPALAAAGDAVRASAAGQLRVEQIDTDHQLQLHFYSANGSIAAFTDHGALVAQVIRDASGTVVYAGETRADYDVVMIIEDGAWHVRHWLRRDAAPAPAAGPARSCAGCVALAQAAATPRLERNGASFVAAGANYYPQATPWDAFWAQYDPAIIDRDFSRIKGLGLNSVRVFVPYQQFGGARIAPAMLAHLADLLDRAQAQRLVVIVTLFDFRAEYDLLHWPDADRHLEALLTRFASHPAILAWDLKNEPDLDDASAGAAVVDAWLAHIAAQARRYDPNHLLTIGWSSAGAARRLAGSVDLVQFHFYAPAGTLAAQYAALQSAAPGRLLLLGEFGLPTWNSVFPNGHTEAEQAAYYADVLAAARRAGGAGYLAWTLYDFASVPANVAGRWPWQTGPQRHMGLLRADGSAKPAASLLAPGAPLSTPAPPAWARLLKPFWLLLLGGLLASILPLDRWARRAEGHGPSRATIRRRLQRFE
ncbi:hypothetical protein [Kouleothrix sp.]|uniref:hypothetical protein n=1 Tax=Kouleothrix sp. TaxID=2779161 RepID=UPI00391D5534